METEESPNEPRGGLIEGLALETFSAWLQFGPDYVNMPHVQRVQDHATATPPRLTLIFHGGDWQDVRGADRLQVLAWLAAQVEAPAP